MVVISSPSRCMFVLALCAALAFANPVTETKLTASDAAAGDHFGFAVAVSGDTVVVGASTQTIGGSSSGSAYVFVRSGTTWTEQQKLTASDGAGGDQADPFSRGGGPIVAVSGDTVVVGAPFDDDAGSASGSAYVYEEAGIQARRQDLQDLVDANPGTLLADKVEGAVASLDTALAELAKTPPDNQAAVGNLEGAVGDLQAAVDAALLDAAQGAQLMDALAGVAQQLAADALAEAIAQGGDAGKIADAQDSLAQGDTLREAQAFKDAVNKYKDALVLAEGA